MEFFDYDQDRDNYIQYTETHDNNENLIFLVERKCDCKFMLLEIKRLLLEDNYEHNDNVKNSFRRKLLDEIHMRYKCNNKKSIRLFLESTYKLIEDYTLGNIDILTFKFELFNTLNHNRKKTETIKNPKPINFYAASIILFELIRLLYVGKFINKLTRAEVLYHFICNGIRLNKRNPIKANHMIIWCALEKDFVYLINGLVQLGLLKSFWKYANVKSHFIMASGEEFKYLSQTSYSFTTGSEDYKNEKLDKILICIAELIEQNKS